ncbi:MAG: DUF5305 domain-containing protein [Halosimplex sp.]
MTPVDESSTTERARLFVASNGALVVAVCLLLAAVGGVVAYRSFTGPDTATEQRTVATWTTDGEFHHAAVVRNGTRAFDEGDVLRNRSVYFSSVAPTLNGTYVFRHSGDAEPATVQTDLRLVVRAVEQTQSGSSVLWDVSERVGSNRASDLQPGSELAVPFAFNVTEQSELAEDVRRELGSARGVVQVRLVANTTVSTTVAGEQFDRERSTTLVVRPRSDSYVVSTEGPGRRRESVTRSVSVPVEPDPVRRYGSLAALLVGLGGLGLVAYLDRTGRLEFDEATRTAMALERDRDDFAEWISTGRLPSAGDERIVTVDSLEDLVDVAIDSDRRVIEDRDSATFAVLDGETRYEFRPTAAAGDPLSDPGAERGNGTGASAEDAARTSETEPVGGASETGDSDGDPLFGAGDGDAADGDGSAPSDDGSSPSAEGE